VNGARTNDDEESVVVALEDALSRQSSNLDSLMTNLAERVVFKENGWRNERIVA